MPLENLPLGSPWPMVCAFVPLAMLWLTARIAVRLRVDALSPNRLWAFFISSAAIFLVVLLIKIVLPHSTVGYLAPLWLVALAVITARCALEHYSLRTGERVGWLRFLRRPREWLPPMPSKLVSREF